MVLSMHRSQVTLQHDLRCRMAHVAYGYLQIVVIAKGHTKLSIVNFGDILEKRYSCTKEIDIVLYEKYKY